VGGAWTYKLAAANTVDCDRAPFQPRSGLLISLSLDQAAAMEFEPCWWAVGDVFSLWLEWWASEFREGPEGQPAAVSVNRIQTGSGGTPRAAAYTGISLAMELSVDPRTHAWMYYAPLLFDTFSPSGWSSKIWIQNSGIECTSVEIWFHKQQDCLKANIQEVLSLCPGETIDVTPSFPGFLGSAWIRASQPLGVIVDEYNGNGSILMSYRGMPAGIYEGFPYGSLFNFAPLIYREYNGWNTGIQVQNLSSVFNALVKVYFLDNSGDIIDTIVDWICPRGSQTFYLPAINNLPGQYVGQARVESQNWWGPGDPPVDAPFVLSVVNLVNYNTGQGAAYNTFPKWQVELGPFNMNWVALPFLSKDKHDPYEPSGTKWTSEIAMTNLDMRPGISTWRIDFFDQNGLLYSICQTLNEKQVDYIKLGNIGIIPPGWLGSAIISKMCALPEDVGALGVVVVEKASGYPSGDLTKVYEGFPLWFPPSIPKAVDCPECEQLCPPGSISGIVTWEELDDGAGAAEALGGVPVLLQAAGHDGIFGTPDDWHGWTLTLNDGSYFFGNLPAGLYRVSVEYNGASLEIPVVLACGNHIFLPLPLFEPLEPCLVTIDGTARVSGGAYLVGATVELWQRTLGDDYELYDTVATNSEGNFMFADVPCGKYHLKVLFLCEGNTVSMVSYDFAVITDFTLNAYLDLDDCTGWWGDNNGG
jgi:hypothetical protein